MMCKHEFYSRQGYVSECKLCGETYHGVEIDTLMADLTAARDELAAEKAGRKQAETRIAELNMVLNENAVKCIKCLSVQKAAIAKSETLREQAEIDSEKTTAKWLQAISTLSTQLAETSTKLQNVEVARERAEAQCAFLAEAYCGECDYDSEICRGTRPDMKCAVRELDGTAAAKLLAELQRYREALTYISNLTGDFDSDGDPVYVDVEGVQVGDVREIARDALGFLPQRGVAGEQGAPFDEYCPNPDKEGEAK